MDDADSLTTTCANCGKGEESTGDLKACTACKLVKYCNRDCQIAHRPLHKKACKKRAAELYDEALFRDHQTPDDCPICFLPLPLDFGRNAAPQTTGIEIHAQTTFQSCCGKIICCGCIYAMCQEDRERGGERGPCAFCRAPMVTSAAEEIQRIKRLMEGNNAVAFNQLANTYWTGNLGMPQDYEKAIELTIRAGELGCQEAYCNLGNAYVTGRGVEMDKKKAKHYYELAAMNGSVLPRHNLGIMELKAGNIARANKHFILSANAGCKDSLDWVRKSFMNNFVTKDEYANTLRAYQQQCDEMKSDARDKAQANVW